MRLVFEVRIGSWKINLWFTGGEPMPRYRLRVFPDYHQFYLHDGEVDPGDFEEMWTEGSLRRRLFIAPGILAILTARNVTVPVEIEVPRAAPNDDFSRWDAVIESGILVPSGSLFVSAVTSESADQIDLAPGCYLARIYYGGLETVTSDLDGKDHYKVVLWPAFQHRIRVLKREPSARRRRSAGRA
jgi:hypothetical protein